MMLSYSLLTEPCVLQRDTVNTLIVENVTQYRKIAEQMILGGDGNICFFENEEEVDKKKILVIHDYFCLNLNDRKFLNRIYAQLDEEAQSGEMMLKTVTMQSVIAQYLEELMFQTDYNIVMEEEVNLQELFKAAGIHIYQEGESLMNKIVDYIGLYTQMFFSRLVVFVGLWEMFTPEEITKIFRYCELNKHYVFDVERRDGQEIFGNKILFDEDLCRVI